MSDPQRFADDDEAREGVQLGVRSGFSVRTRRPFVEIAFGDTHVELGVKDAMELAWSIQFATTAAISEASGIEAAGGEKLTTEEVGNLLNQLAAARIRVNEREDME